MNHTLSEALLSELGFEPATKCTFNQKLDCLRPSGGTALRDSVKLGTGDIWNFLHIVITDGVDSGSKTSIEELAVIFYIIGQTIPTDRCQTNYIGINLSGNAAAEMAVMSACGGDSCKAHRASNVDLSEIFERISIGIGIIKQTQAIGVTDCTNASLMIHEQSAPVLTMRRNRFAVLLNLDFSNSMDGANWNSLKSSVAMFLRSLQEGDIVSCLLFNHKVMLLSEMNIPACLPPASSSARNFSSPSYNPIQSSISPPKQASGKAINSGTDSSAVNCKCNLV